MNKLLDLNEYSDIAKRQLMRFGGPISTKILSDEQAFGDVVREIMIADSKHDPIKGRQRKSWLNQHAMYAVYDYVNSYKKVKKTGVCSIEDIGQEDCMTPSETEDIDNRNRVDYLINNSKLTDNEIAAIKSRYFENKKLKEIANDLNLSVWGVSLMLKSALKKMRRKLSCSKA